MPVLPTQFTATAAPSAAPSQAEPAPTVNAHSAASSLAVTSTSRSTRTVDDSTCAATVFTIELTLTAAAPLSALPMPPAPPTETSSGEDAARTIKLPAVACMSTWSRDASTWLLIRLTLTEPPNPWPDVASAAAPATDTIVAWSRAVTDSVPGPLILVRAPPGNPACASTWLLTTLAATEPAPPQLSASSVLTPAPTATLMIRLRASSAATRASACGFFRPYWTWPTRSRRAATTVLITLLATATPRPNAPPLTPTPPARLRIPLASPAETTRLPPSSTLARLSSAATTLVTTQLKVKVTPIPIFSCEPPTLAAKEWIWLSSWARTCKSPSVWMTPGQSPKLARVVLVIRFTPTDAPAPSRPPMPTAPPMATISDAVRAETRIPSAE